jgi:hypothetical protein
VLYIYIHYFTDDTVSLTHDEQRLFQVCAKNGLVGNMVMREIGDLKPRLVPDGTVPQRWKTRANDK